MTTYEARGRQWIVDEQHPQTGEEFAVCREVNEYGGILCTAILARAELRDPSVERARRGPPANR